MVAGARQVGLSISETADLLQFSQQTISRVYGEWSERKKISCVVGKNAMLIPEISWRWSDRFEMIERQQ